MRIWQTQALPKAASIRETAMKKLISPGRRMWAVGLAAAANVTSSSFNPKVSRSGKGDSPANKADRADSKQVAAVANIASRFNPKDRHRADNMAHRAGSKVAARVREKGRKENLPQLRPRANLTTIRPRTAPVIPGAVSLEHGPVAGAPSGFLTRCLGNLSTRSSQPSETPLSAQTEKSVFLIAGSSLQ